MPITVCCRSPACREVFDVRDSFAGMHVRCPACGTPVAVSTHTGSSPAAVPGKKRRPAITPLALPVDEHELPPLPAPAPVPSRRRMRGKFGGRFARSGRKSPAQRGPRQRHGCVTAWLLLIVVGNLAGILLTLYLEGEASRQGLQLPAAVLLVPIAVCAAGIVCAVALLNWKKWGFWGIFVLVAISTTLSVMYDPRPQGLVGGPVSLLVLYLVLQMGNKRSTWSQLE